MDNLTEAVALEDVPPTFERTLDEAAQDNWFYPTLEFMDSLPSVDPEQQTPMLLQLSPMTRYNIYDYVFEVPYDAGIISLSSKPVTRDVFPADYFLSYAATLESGKALAETSRQLRDEVMTYFWTRYRFHVTLSPFTGLHTSPLSQKVLKVYSDVVQRLRIELDFTRLGFGPSADALQLRADPKPMMNLLRSLIDDLRMRQHPDRSRRGDLYEIHLMCRRFKGDRPLSTLPGNRVAPVPYCDDAVFNHFVNIAAGFRGMVTRLRLSGFSLKFNNKVFQIQFEPPYLPPVISDCKEDLEAWPADYTPPPVPATQPHNVPGTPSTISSNVTWDDDEPAPPKNRADRRRLEKEAKKLAKKNKR